MFDRTLLITAVCDYLAGSHRSLIDQRLSATSTTVSVSSLSFSTSLVQYCRYYTPGVSVVNDSPVVNVCCVTEAPAGPPKFDLHVE